MQTNGKSEARVFMLKLETISSDGTKLVSLNIYSVIPSTVTKLITNACDNHKHTTVTSEHLCPVASTPASYSEGNRFMSRLGDRLYWLKINCDLP